jgi:signal transduction histidine kinase
MARLLRRLQTITFRIIIAFTFIILLLVIQAVFAFYSAHDLLDTQDQGQQEQIELLAFGDNLASLRILVLKYLATQNLIDAEVIKSEIDALTTVIEGKSLELDFIDEQITELGVGEEGEDVVVERTMIAQVLATYQEVITEYDDYHAIQANRLINGLSQTQHEEIIQTLDIMLQEAQINSNRSIDSGDTRFLGVIVVLCSVSVIAAVIWGRFLINSIVTPVRQLTESAERVSRGDLSIDLNVSRQDEIGQLGGAFNEMVVNLRTTMASLVAKEYIEKTIDTVPEGVLLLDDSRKIVLANPIAQKGLPALGNAGVGDMLEYMGSQPINELLTSPPKGLWHEVKVINDELQIFEVISRPIEVGATTSGWVIVFRDVTQEREIQERIQNQNRLASVGQFAAGIAHDFNNLIAVIILQAQLVMRTDQLLPETQKRLDIVVEQSRRATNLIQQILDFSRRTVIERQPIDLKELMIEQTNLIERILPTSIEIILEYDDEDYMINADPTRIQQVTMNLFVNARDAMPGGGRLDIKLVRVDNNQEIFLQGEGFEDWIQLTVSDTGSGIPAEIVQRVFDPFFTTKAPGKGTGLGLAQVYGIVKQHDGFIDVVTEAGKGTSFVIHLPVFDALPIQ